MESTFAFFLEPPSSASCSTARRTGQAGHLAATAALFLGSWLSGYFIIATNAFMQHPVGTLAVDGALQLQSSGLRAQRVGSVAVRAQHVRLGRDRLFRVAGIAPSGRCSAARRRGGEPADGVTLGLIACVLQLFPTGDRQGKLVARHQPVALAAMEAVSREASGAPGHHRPTELDARTLGEPDPRAAALSFLAYGSFGSTVKGLSDFPISEWPDNIELLYYAYHIMVGLGSLFIALMAVSAVQLWRGRLGLLAAALVMLMLAIPFPYIANTAGWTVAELGRQPWIIYGLMRTADGTSPRVGAGDTAFTTLGFLGLYFRRVPAVPLPGRREIATAPSTLRRRGP